MEELNVSIKKSKDIYILHFKGVLDSMVIAGLRHKIEDEMDSIFQHIILDLKEVEFLDSTAVGLLAYLLRKTHARSGRTLVTGAHGQPRAVLELIGFDDLVEYTESEEEALSLLKA